MASLESTGGNVAVGGIDGRHAVAVGAAIDVLVLLGSGFGCRHRRHGGTDHLNKPEYSGYVPGTDRHGNGLHGMGAAEEAGSFQLVPEFRESCLAVEEGSPSLVLSVIKYKN